MLDRGAAVVHVDPADAAQRALGAAELEDAETGERMLIDIDSELLSLLERACRPAARLGRACASRGVPYAQAPADAAAGRLLAGALVDAGILAA